jgi:hypothetical protein
VGGDHIDLMPVHEIFDKSARLKNAQGGFLHLVIDKQNIRSNQPPQEMDPAKRANQYHTPTYLDQSIRNRKDDTLQATGFYVAAPDQHRSPQAPDGLA